MEEQHQTVGQTTPSRSTVIAGAQLLKALGHTGVDHMLLELDLQNSEAGKGSGLMGRATSLAQYALANPEAVTPEGQGKLAKELHAAGYEVAWQKVA